MPTVSVIMPVYNTAKYLATAVQSILGQTFKDFELIALNDGSTDGSLAILEDFAIQDARIRVISGPNKGIVSARNDAIAAATGQFIACADSDDISLPNRFERQCDFLRCHPYIAVVGGAVQEMDAAGNLMDRIHTYVTDSSEIERALLTGCCFAQPAVMASRKAVLAVGGYRKAFAPAEDYDLWLRLSERHPLANLGDILVHYRQHPSSAVSTGYLNQAIAVRVAQKSAEFRRQGHRDSVSSDSVFTPELFAELGISTAELEMIAGVAYRHRASQLIHRGEYPAAADTMERYDRADIAPWVRRKMAGEFEFLKARMYMAKKKPIAAAGWAVKAVAHPAFIGELGAKTLRKLKRTLS